MSIPAYLPYYVIGGCLGIIAAVLVGLNAALRKADWPKTQRRSAIGASALILIGWFATALVLSWSEAYRGALDQAPTIQFGVVIPILIGGFLIWRSNSASRLIDAAPQEWLVGVQFYRALGAIFLVLYGSGKLPGLFALPAGLGDVLVGLLAPIVALLYARGPRENGGLVAAWNIFGLVDLLVAVAMGFLTSPSPIQLLSVDAPNELISAFPLVLIPVFLVPLSVLLHIASLTKLRGATSRTLDHAKIATSSR